MSTPTSEKIDVEPVTPFQVIASDEYAIVFVP